MKAFCRSLQVSLYLTLGLSLLLIMGCFAQSDDGTYAPIPDIDSFCHNTITGCESNQAGAVVRLGLIAESLDCEFHMSPSMSPSHFTQLFDASSQAITYSEGQGLFAIFSDWKGSLGQLIGSLERGSYTACAFLDLDGDGQMDTNEPRAQSLIEVGSETAPEINQWFPGF